jgi:hypothetical protein
LPLPSSDAAYSTGFPAVVEAFDGNGDIALLSAGDSRSRPQASIEAELMKLYSLW